MKSVAAWLVARPQNAIIGLAGTLLLPFAHLISGTVMALLVIKQGMLPSTLQGVVATVILSASSLIVHAPVSHVLANAVVIWLPVMLLSVLLRRWGSLNLTLQLWVLVAMVATIAFFVVLDDPTVFWTGVLERLSGFVREMGFEQQAAILYEQRAAMAPQATMLVVLGTWSLYAIVLLFGNGVFGTLPQQKNAAFGRFCDLNFGRVLALIMALTSVISVIVGAVWLKNLAFVAFAVFWLQGLAIVHWLHVQRRIPGFVVVLVYFLILLLNAVFILALAVVGYIDAWLGFRTRKRHVTGI